MLMVHYYILQDRGLVVDVATSFDEFANMLAEDKRVTSLDAGNIKLTYNSVI